MYLPICLSLSATTYYVAPNGSDSNTGSISQPFFTLKKAWTVLFAGDIVYLRGGTYHYTSDQALTGKNGTSSNPISILAYPGEVPVITKAGSWSYRYQAGIYFEGDYFHWKGITVSGYGQTNQDIMHSMIVQYSSHNTFENMIFSYSCLGFDLSHGSDDNLILNCDFHHNFNPISESDAYGSADGANTHTDTGTTNTFRNCRFWSNSDDGIDMYNGDGMIILDGCWSWLNGFAEDGTTVGGDGYGYKLGVTSADFSSSHLRTITNCMAFYNRLGGFGINNALCIVWMYNNTAFHNSIGDEYSLGFVFDDHEGTSHIIRNNLGYDNQNSRGLQANWTPESTVDHNSWDIGATLTDADFISTDSSGVTGPRDGSGNLPYLYFMKLAEGSDMIDAGTDVDLPYNGSAPDIGAYEFESYVPPSPLYTSSAIESATPSVLQINYNLSLNSSVVPANSSFKVKVNTIVRNVNSVSVSGTKVMLTLASPVVYGDAITVDYTKPTSNPLQTSSGGEAASITDQRVTNNVKPVNPVYVSSSVEDASPAVIGMTFNLSLASKIPAGSAFRVVVNSAARTVNSVAISGTKVLLTLSSPVAYGDIVVLSYTKPATNPIQTTAGGTADNIVSKPVTNNCAKPAVPPVVPPMVPDPYGIVLEYPKTVYEGFVSEINATPTALTSSDSLIFEWSVPDGVPVSTVKSLKTMFLAPVVSGSEIVKFKLRVSDGKTILLNDIPITVVPYKPQLSAARITGIEASDFQSPNIPTNILDGNILTKWTSNGDDKWLIVKLARPFKISHLLLGFLTGQAYESRFDVYASKDKLNWEPVLTNISSCSFSGERQVFDFPPSNTTKDYQYLKYVGHGNTLNALNNISELKIFGTPASTVVIDKRKIILYPNPVQDFLNISIEETSLEFDKVRILDYSGKIVFERVLNPVTKNLQFPINLKSGIYLVDLGLRNLILYTQELIVNK